MTLCGGQRDAPGNMILKAKARRDAGPSTAVTGYGPLGRQQSAPPGKALSRKKYFAKIELGLPHIVLNALHVPVAEQQNREMHRFYGRLALPTAVVLEQRVCLCGRRRIGKRRGKLREDHLPRDEGHNGRRSVAGNAARGAGRGVEQCTAATRAGPQQRLVIRRICEIARTANPDDRTPATLHLARTSFRFSLRHGWTHSLLDRSVRPVEEDRAR